MPAPASNARFTLVELMIVVAILGVLASIAIPAFAEFQLQARRSESIVNASGIADAALGYTTELTTSSQAGSLQPRPDGDLDKSAVPWKFPADWDVLGWAPDGDLRCNYSWEARSGIIGGVAYQPRGYVSSTCDVDNDNAIYNMGFQAGTAVLDPAAPAAITCRCSFPAVYEVGSGCPCF